MSRLGRAIEGEPDFDVVLNINFDAVYGYKVLMPAMIAEMDIGIDKEMLAAIYGESGLPTGGVTS